MSTARKAAKKAPAIQSDEHSPSMNRVAALIQHIHRKGLPVADEVQRKQIVLRIETGLLANVDALAVMTGVSRNGMLDELLRIAVDAVQSEFDPSLRAAFVDAQNEANNQL